MAKPREEAVVVQRSSPSIQKANGSLGWPRRRKNRSDHGVPTAQSQPLHVATRFLASHSARAESGLPHAPVHPENAPATTSSPPATSTRIARRHWNSGTALPGQALPDHSGAAAHMRPCGRAWPRSHPHAIHAVARESWAPWLRERLLYGSNPTRPQKIGFRMLPSLRSAQSARPVHSRHVPLSRCHSYLKSKIS